MILQQMALAIALVVGVLVVNSLVVRTVVGSLF
jgi:hypothetical protein